MRLFCLLTVDDFIYYLRTLCNPFLFSLPSHSIPNSLFSTLHSIPDSFFSPLPLYSQFSLLSPPTLFPILSSLPSHSIPNSLFPPLHSIPNSLFPPLHSIPNSLFPPLHSIPNSLFSPLPLYSHFSSHLSHFVHLRTGSSHFTVLTQQTSPPFPPKVSGSGFSQECTVVIGGRSLPPQNIISFRHDPKAKQCPCTLSIKVLSSLRLPLNIFPFFLLFSSYCPLCGILS